jgi:hypothetical protein
MEVSLYQQYWTLSFLGEGNRKIECSRGLSIVRQRACNQKSFELLGVPDLVKPQPQKPEAVGGGAPGVSVSGDPALGPDLDCFSRNLKAKAAGTITRLFFIGQIVGFSKGVPNPTH